jgi:hypothetical protein
VVVLSVMAVVFTLLAALQIRRRIA